MTPVEFLELYQCKFEVSERDQGLYKRVEEYFKNTDNLPLAVSFPESRKLTKWAENNGFSRHELNRAKGLVDRYLPKQG